MSMIDKNKLIADRVINRTAVIEIEGVGKIKIRALSRMELIRSFDIPTADGEQERFVISSAMVEPAMSPDDVKAWQEASPGYEMNYVASKINELSGLRKGADKSGVPEV